MECVPSSNGMDWNGMVWNADEKFDDVHLKMIIKMCR